MLSATLHWSGLKGGSAKKDSLHVCLWKVSTRLVKQSNYGMHVFSGRNIVMLSLTSTHDIEGIYLNDTRMCVCVCVVCVCVSLFACVSVSVGVCRYMRAAWCHGIMVLPLLGVPTGPCVILVLWIWMGLH